MSSAKPPAYALAPKAEADLETIWRYTAQTWSIKQADTYVRELTGTFSLIASMPEMARERREFNPPVRIHVNQSHLVVYLLRDPGIVILRVLGGQQDWVSILNDAEP